MNAIAGQFVVMGVSGCGKSEVAKLLAERTGGCYLDADDFHPAANKAKMAAGIPLTDEDRWPWLDALNQKLKSRNPATDCVFLACSALRRSYRERLSSGLPELRFIYLKGTAEVIRLRLENRKNHFMPASLLDSQFAVLEEPSDAIMVDTDQSLQAVVETTLKRLAPPDPVFVPPGGPPQGPGPSKAIFSAMGEVAIFRMCRDFYDEIGRSPIRPLFAQDLPKASEKLAAFLVGITGGPPLYHERHGNPMMRARHLAFPIDEAARRTWLDSFFKTLEGAETKYGFPPEHLPGFKRWLEDFSAWMVNRRA